MKILYPPFLDNIQTNHLIEKDDTIILAFSGGKDSITLCHLLRQLKKNIKFHLVAAYFNHKLRSDVEKEQEWVQRFCKEHKIELVIGSKNVIRFKNRHKLNLEHAASLSRYSFFKEVSARYKNGKVATAHNRSDLTETFLIKLSRGSGLQGLTTISSKKDNFIIRPLLLFEESEILDFLKRNKFSYFSDYTNEEDIFLRNRFRHHVVPELKKIEPNIHNHVYKTVTIIQDEYDYFNAMAQRILKENLILEAVLPAVVLAKYHIAIQRHVVREYIRLLKGNLLNIGFEHIEAVRTGNSDAGGLALPGLQLNFKKGFIFPNTFSIPSYRYDIPTVESMKINELGKILRIERISGYKKPVDNNEIIVPERKVEFPLTLRNADRGDKYIKINSSVRQKVFEMIRASGIPYQLRNMCPVLINGNGQIIWALGSPVADSFRVEDNRDIRLLKINLV